jgi:NADH-quinone oxidoreductase subunit G
MACPGGCIGGAGQPVSHDAGTRSLRTKGIYDIDKNLDLHRSQENHYVAECYHRHLDGVGSEKAHHLLHTHYLPRPMYADESVPPATLN